MWVFVLTALDWIKSNVKWIVIGAAVLVGAFALNTLYNTILENGQYQIEVKTLKESIESQRNLIVKMQEDRLLVEQVIKERDDRMQILQGQIDGITDDLGEGTNDQAPDVYKELFRRLNQRVVK